MSRRSMESVLMIVHAAPNDVRVAREAAAAVDVGYAVDVLAARGRTAQTPVIPGLHYTELPVVHRRGAGVGGAFVEYMSFTGLATLRTAARQRRRADAVVHVHNPPDFLLLAALVPKLLGAKVILDVHDLSTDMFAMRFGNSFGGKAVERLLRLIESLAVRSADAILTVHEPYRQELIARGATPERVRVVMNAVDPAVLPSREQVMPADDCFRVVYHGTLTPHYGVEVLVRACAEARKRIPDLQLKLYGAGDAVADLKQVVAELAMEECVTFVGPLPQKEVLKHVAVASVGVIPNLPARLNRYALSSKLFEYVALGIPVVSSDLPTIREHFSESEVNFFRAGDPAALANALVGVAEDSTAARSRASAARKTYESNYAWEISAGVYTQLLDELTRVPSRALGAGRRSTSAGRPPTRPSGPAVALPTRGPDRQDVAITASTQVAFFDHFRVPHRLEREALPPDPNKHLRTHCEFFSVAGTARAVFWPRPDVPRQYGHYRFGDIRFRGPLVTDDRLLPWLSGPGSTWVRDRPVVDARGEWIASTWVDDRGNRLLPFDPSQLIRGFWNESYMSHAGRGVKLQALLTSYGYYRVRGAVPHGVRLLARRAFARLQALSRFPSWPVEPSLDLLFDFLFEATVTTAGTSVPWIAPWPDDFLWAQVLTHDVESEHGVAGVDVLRRLEEDCGYRGSWNFVPMRYAVSASLLEELRLRGCEVGVHGLYHDGYDLRVPEFHERVAEMRRFAAEWEAVGFRSPSTLRSLDVVSQLPFEYDSSYPDTDPFEPQPGGCGSILPFFHGDVVELPITLPQDHTIFDVLRHEDGRIWREKIDYIRARGGFALMLTHPDYVSPYPTRLETYRSFLEELAEDPSAWRPLPRDVAAWWRERGSSQVTWEGDRWQVSGSSRARVRFAEPER